MDQDQIVEPWLNDLNDQQRRAVTSDRKQVVILAGPGSGKTRIIVHRVAYLLKCLKMNPRKIIVATFTNKAARELKERVGKLIGTELAGRLMLGTYHRIMMTLLRRHGRLIDLENFTIVDQEDAKAIVRELVNDEGRKEPRDLPLATKPKVITELTFKWISKAKSRNIPPAAFLDHFDKRNTEIDPQYIQEVYRDYEENLVSNNLLDFDDILIYGLRLLRRHPFLVKRVDHVLIDEFQDTNTIQYYIMEKLVENTDRVTIVGDPDQSIYGWRSADITNLKRFQENYSDIDMVFLEQNYRSTQSILRASLSVISQDQERIVKGLWTKNDEGPAVVLKSCRNQMKQSEFVVNEIQRLKNHSRGMLDWKDFAILYRIGRIGYSLEQHLQLARIPYAISGGVQFFDRKEIKDILAYMRLADNPNDMPSFLRVLNVPPRKIGKKTKQQILDSAKRLNIGEFQVCERIAAGNRGLARVSAALIKPFVDTVRHVRRMANDKSPIVDMMRYIIDAIEYEKYLEKTCKGEHQDRLKHLTDFMEYAKAAEVEIQKQMNENRQVNDNENSIDGEGADVILNADGSMLNNFLADIALQSNGDERSRTKKDDNVVKLMTIHASKGLEFPVVFIIGADDGMIPHSMSSDIAEERRVLYVGMTRAQALLYISHSEEHPFIFLLNTEWSPFVQSLMASASIQNAMQPKLIMDTAPTNSFIASRKIINIDSWTEIARVLGREFDASAPISDDPDDRPVIMTPIKLLRNPPFGSPGSGRADYEMDNSPSSSLDEDFSSDETPSKSHRSDSTSSGSKLSRTPSKSSPSSSAAILKNWLSSAKKPVQQSPLSNSLSMELADLNCDSEQDDMKPEPHQSLQDSPSMKRRRPS